MSFTNQTLDGLDRGLATLAPLCAADPQVPFRVAVAIERLTPLIRALRTTERKYVEVYGAHDANGALVPTENGGYTIGDVAGFGAAMDALYSAPVDLPVLPTITLDDLTALDVRPSATLLLQLRPLLPPDDAVSP